MGYIKTETIERVKDIDIVQVVKRRCPDLKKTGANYKCLSPFTDEKTPSFVVSPAKGIFKCFSTGKSGNVISFVMETQNLNFPEAIEYLAHYDHIEVEYDNSETAQKKAEVKAKKDDLRPILKSTANLFRNNLKSVDKNHPAIAELAKREYDDDIILEYGIGLAVGNHQLYNKLKEAGRTSDGRELGLIGDSNDKLFNRLTYQLKDRNGLLLGFASRALSEDSKTAKWMNPPDTPLFRKDKFLFGLDKAARDIARRNEVYIAEGYNDVIAMHLAGARNTVSSSGTAITASQIQLLKSLTSKATLAMDGDAAGIKAMLKYAPEFLKAGFSTYCLMLPEQDPDDFLRERKEEIQNAVSLDKYFEDNELKINAFQFLINHHLKDKSPADQIPGLKLMVEIIANVDDKTFVDLYVEWLAKNCFQTPSGIRKAVKEYQQEQLEKQNNHALKAKDNWQYNWPDQLKIDEGKAVDMVDRYGMFIDRDRIYMKRGTEPPFNFATVSNFSIEIIQHMQDEKHPMKLLRIKNTEGKEKIFDTKSDSLNTPQTFMNVMAGHGNFFWEGTSQDHMRLLKYLFAQMGDGEKIEVMGWQPQGFFVFNNMVIKPGTTPIELSDNGVFKIKDQDQETTYYVPSANVVYRNNPYKFQPQKKVQVKGPIAVSFTQYTSMMKKVHREHSISAILFTVASVFQDIVIDANGNFPILFLYGPPSSGKDQLIDCCQSFFGLPQEAINLESGISTAKGSIREFAQFRNMISHLSEYGRGDKKLDGMLKGLWDRRGYKRGTIDSHVGTESIPILSSVILTGNDYPDNDALITRVIWEEMTQTEFSEEAMRDYDQLKDLYKKGISQLTIQLLQHRALWEEKFKDTFRKVSINVKTQIPNASKHSRIISNFSVLMAGYEIMKDHFQFPFSYNDIIEHFRATAENQLKKLNTASLHSKWWDCFVAVSRTKGDPLLHERDFNIHDDRFYFSFTNCYNRIAPQWYRQYNEPVPSKSRLQDALQSNEGLMLEVKNSHRFGPGRNSKKSSAYSVSLKGTNVMEEIFGAIEWQAEILGYQKAKDLSAPNEETPDDLPF